MTNKEAINIIKSECYVFNLLNLDRSTMINTALDMAIKALERQSENAVSRQAVEDVVDFECGEWRGLAKTIIKKIEDMPSAQPEIIRCKDCEYGEQDEVGRWFCRSLGCQIGNEDGSGYCADALNRKEGLWHKDGGEE